MEIRPTYDPKDPIFNESTLPDEFSLADMAHYPDLPAGLSELTIDGAELHGKGVPLVRIDQGWRTFLMKESDHAAAMVRLDGGMISESVLIDYLQSEARHVTGFHVREMGLLAAALYDLACAFTEQNEWFLLDHSHRLPEIPACVAGQPMRTHALHQHVIQIEIQERPPSEGTMLGHAGHALRNWHHWIEANEQLTGWIESGRLPRGISTYREIAPGGAHVIRNIHQAPRSLNGSDVFIVTTMDGVVCMMCLDTLRVFGDGNAESKARIMHWMGLTHPRLLREMMVAGSDDWCYIEALCLYVAEVAIEDHQRTARRMAWPLKQIPMLKGPHGLSPFVLSVVVREPRFDALDMARVLRGAG